MMKKTVKAFAASHAASVEPPEFAWLANRNRAAK
jgi:hypothetical protein